MSNRELYRNNVSVALGAAVALADPTVTVDTGLGALFGTVNANEFIRGVLKDDLGNYEIVLITAVTGDVVTVTRAQEGTSALDFNLVDNPTLSCRLTKGSMERLPQLNADETVTGNWTFNDGGARLGSIQVFTPANDGPGTYAKPAGLKFVIVKLQAAGGGGGGNGNTGSGEQSNGGGGGAGGFVWMKIAAGSLGATENTVCGDGGAGGSTTTGSAGGAASFGAHCSATGGGGGNTVAPTTSGNSGGGGDGGAGTGGDFNAAGQPGAHGHASVGGGAFGRGGNGAASHFGGGGKGTRGGGGAAATAPGAGGGGSGDDGATGTGRNGGAGGDARIEVWEYF